MLRTGVIIIALLALMGCTEEQSLSDTQYQALSLVADGSALLVDVRTQEEIAEGYLNGALHIPYQNIVPALAKLTLPKDADIVLYCRSGNRAGKAAEALRKAGYSRVINAGGYDELQTMKAQLEQRNDH